MTQNERRLILAENAQETIEKLREGLDLSNRPCGECSRTHYSNWPHRLIDQRADAALTKIAGIIRELTILVETEDEINPNEILG